MADIDDELYQERLKQGEETRHRVNGKKLKIHVDRLIIYCMNVR